MSRLTCITTSSRWPWSAIVEPPMKMQETPSRWTLRLNRDADLTVKSSGSMRAATKVPPFFRVVRRALSVGPASLKLCTRLGEVVYKAVVHVDVGFVGCEAVLASQFAVTVSARDYGNVVL